MTSATCPLAIRPPNPIATANIVDHRQTSVAVTNNACGDTCVPNSVTGLLRCEDFVRFDPCDMVMEARPGGEKHEIAIQARRIATSGESAKTNIAFPSRSAKG